MIIKNKNKQERPLNQVCAATLAVWMSFPSDPAASFSHPDQGFFRGGAGRSLECPSADASCVNLSATPGLAV